MVVDDDPATFVLTQYEAECPTDGFRSLQFPSTEHKGEIGARLRDLDVAEGKAPHGLTGGIALMVPVQRGLPAAGDFASGTERKVRRMPIGDHEGVDIARVPGLGLLFEHSRNLFAGSVLTAWRCAAGREYRDANEPSPSADS